MPYEIVCRLHRDFDVVAKPIQAIHQLAFRHIREIAPKHGGHFWLGMPMRSAAAA